MFSERVYALVRVSIMHIRVFWMVWNILATSMGETLLCNNIPEVITKPSLSGSGAAQEYTDWKLGEES